MAPKAASQGRFSRKITWLRTCSTPLVGLAAVAQVGEDAHAVHHRALRVLRDHRIQRAVDQQRPRVRREAVADEDRLARQARLVDGAPDAFGAAADVVDAGQVAVLLEQRPRLAVVLLGVVVALARAHHVHARALLLEQVQEAGLALLVRPVAQRAGDHRHLGRAAARQRAHEARDQVGGGAAGGAVVQADIGAAGRVRQVRDQRDVGTPRRRQFGHRLAHQRMLQRHEGDAVALLAVPQQLPWPAPRG
jgi:hypothetical protein